MSESEHTTTAKAVFKRMLTGWVSVVEAAAIIDVSEQTVRSYIKKGILKHYKVGGRYRIPVRALKQFLGMKTHDTTE